MVRSPDGPIPPGHLPKIVIVCELHKFRRDLCTRRNHGHKQNSISAPLDIKNESHENTLGVLLL